MGLNPVGLSGRSHLKTRQPYLYQINYYPVGKTNCATRWTTLSTFCAGASFLSPRKAISILSSLKPKLLLRFLACPSMQVLRGSSGVITSPYYPSNYGNNHRCRWKITGSSGDRVKLVIHGASLESCCDYIQIQNGYLQSSGSNPGAMYGSRGTMTFISSGEILILYFYSDGSVTRSGFRATYTILRNGK